jgi:hypothetical protein
MRRCVHGCKDYEPLGVLLCCVRQPLGVQATDVSTAMLRSNLAMQQLEGYASDVLNTGVAGVAECGTPHLSCAFPGTGAALLHSVLVYGLGACDIHTDSVVGVRFLPPFRPFPFPASIPAVTALQCHASMYGGFCFSFITCSG